jgi:hypothetical protein
MGTVVFSDVHADASAISSVAACIRSRFFAKSLGPVDRIVNLGDLLHRGDRPKETLEKIHSLAQEFRLVSVLGNHDHAFLHGLMVSGSDAASTYRHEQLRDSPLLSIFDRMPMEYVDDSMLFVHGGPLDLGTQTLRLKCWQRLSREAGDYFTGYHYTADMAFTELTHRRLTHMCCGHQHRHICCRMTDKGVVNYPLDFTPLDGKIKDVECRLEIAKVPLDIPTIVRVGGCHGKNPEFGYTDYSTFTFIRMV